MYTENLSYKKKMFEQRIENVEFLVKFKDIKKKEVIEILKNLQKEESELDNELNKCKFKIQVCEEYLSIYDIDTNKK